MYKIGSPIAIFCVQMIAIGARIILIRSFVRSFVHSFIRSFVQGREGGVVEIPDGEVPARGLRHLGQRGLRRRVEEYINMNVMYARGTGKQEASKTDARSYLHCFWHNFFRHAAQGDGN
jgi:hypothetical protein